LCSIARLYEAISLTQCDRVLGNYKKYLVCPDTIHLQPYHALSPDLEVIQFDPRYFKNLLTYSELLLSKSFYQSFQKYRYMLIYHLDAFVFRDELMEWCNQGYDYIGAPWLDRSFRVIDFHFKPFVRFIYPFGQQKERQVGNGGLSLRNIEKHLSVLHYFEKQAIQQQLHEDVFWSAVCPAYFPNFHIPSVEVALRFAFEQVPAQCYEQNGQVLPFGCHGWYIKDFDFWMPFIKEAGYKLD
jgi:hypothetical protein